MSSEETMTVFSTHCIKVLEQFQDFLLAQRRFFGSDYTLSLISLYIVQAESYTNFCFCSQQQEVTGGKKK